MSDRVIWQHNYHGFESISDLDRDISECLDDRFNEKAKGIPGEFQGTIRVTVEYFPDGIE
jgi:hypothetical protein